MRYLDGSTGLLFLVAFLLLLVVTALRTYDDRTIATDDEGVPW